MMQNRELNKRWLCRILSLVAKRVLSETLNYERMEAIVKVLLKAAEEILDILEQKKKEKQA